MPNYYAHLQFGGLVLAALSPQLSAELNQSRAAFDLACLGPDPLYFYHVHTIKNPIRAEALRMHHEAGRIPLERLRSSMLNVQGRSAMAGFFCHYALDSLCHSYILRVTKGRGHTALEVGFDRLLMERNGFHTPRTAGFPAPAKEFAVYHAAASAYRLADGQTLRAGCQKMSLYAQGLGRIYRVQHGEESTHLLHLFHAAVQPTAIRLTAFLGGGALDAWYDRDFYGHMTGEVLGHFAHKSGATGIEWGQNAERGCFDWRTQHNSFRKD